MGTVCTPAKMLIIVNDPLHKITKKQKRFPKLPLVRIQWLGFYSALCSGGTTATGTLAWWST